MFDGHNYAQLGTGGYTAKFKGIPDIDPRRVTPNFEKKEGLRFGPFIPAAYLPSLRLEPYNHDHVVIAAGAPVAVDSRGRAVPAGYKLILAAGAGQGPQYSALDVAAGVKNAAGNPVTVGEYVVTSLLSEGITIGNVIGVASYDASQVLASDVHNPATYPYHNYNRQNGISLLTSYLLEFPVEPLKRTAHTKTVTATAGQTTIALDHATVVPHSVEVTVDQDRVVKFTFTNNTAPTADAIVMGDALQAGQVVVVKYLFEEAFYQAPFAGMTTWRGDVGFGLVTFDADSKFKLYSAPAIDDTDAETVAASVAELLASKEDIVGLVTHVAMDWPKQLLDKVKTAYDTRLYSPIINPINGQVLTEGLDKMPGSATDGVPHQIQYAGGDLKTGMVTFHLRLK